MTELAEATPAAMPARLVRRGLDQGAAFGPLAATRLKVEGVAGDTSSHAEFATARADVPVTVVGVSEYKPKGWLIGNHLEVGLSSGAPMVILEPVGYPVGSELKVWATQDATGGCGLKFNGAFVDHSGRGFAPINLKPGAVDFYHFYLRPSGEWWLEEHQ